jgi:acetyl esterase/lipase
MHPSLLIVSTRDRPDPRQTSSVTDDVLTRPAPPPDVVLCYGEHPDHVIDLRLPAGAAGKLVIFLHGGFWRAAFDRSHTGPLAVDLASRGYAVACVEYRRVGQPGGGWPGTLDDVAQALAALPGLARPHCDPAGAILAGHSAGGHLALLNAGTPGLAGVVALAPVADLGAAHQAGIGANAVADLLGGGPAEVPDRYDRADPARRGPLPVRTEIVHGDLDDRVPLGIAVRYADEVAGPRCRLRVLQGEDHFGVIDPLSTAWPHVLEALASVRAGR